MRAATTVQHGLTLLPAYEALQGGSDHPGIARLHQEPLELSREISGLPAVRETGAGRPVTSASRATWSTVSSVPPTGPMEWTLIDG